MKSQISLFLLLAAAVTSLAGRTVPAGNFDTPTIIMTITTTDEKSGVDIILAGAGMVTIDWGDGSPLETVTLTTDKGYGSGYDHRYSKTRDYTIFIYGPGITYMNCRDHRLTKLDVSGNSALTELNCSENQLTSLDVGGNALLTVLNCRENRLTKLDVSGNSSLTELDCRENQLTALDVSGNTSLTELDCDENQLTSLDVSDLTSLTDLYCSDNQLQELDVTANIALESLHRIRHLLNIMICDGIMIDNQLVV